MTARAEKPRPAFTSEREVLVALRDRFGPPEWALVEHVASGTGALAGRVIDAVAMNMWPSRGLELYGFEVKVSRSDWLRELRDPKKADDVAKHLDRFWLVVGDASIVLDGELPSSWGLIVPDGRAGLRIKVQAPALWPADAGRGAVVDRAFVAAIIRRVTDGMVPRETIQEQLHQQWAKGRESGQDSAKSELDRAKAEAARLTARIEEFEGASGVRIDRWTRGNIAEAVRVVLETAPEKIAERVSRIRKEALAIIAAADAAERAAGDGR